MSETRGPAIFVGLPAYRGEEFLAETLRSILAQEFEDFRVLISVDGGDEPSADVCATYLADPRIEVVLQQERRGWAGNLNWLMARSTGDFFCYWPQDDVCAPTYFRILHEYAAHHPDAACVYADMQWFGSRDHCDRMPSVIGPALARVLGLFEATPRAPFYGLVRHGALQGAGPLRVNAYDSRLEDYVWVTKLAREGELHHVPGTLYYKRAHARNTHSFNEAREEDRRGIWTEYGLGILEAAIPLVADAERATLLSTVLERLLLPRAGRWMTYDPPAGGLHEIIDFANQFVDATTGRFGTKGWTSVPRLPDPRAVSELVAAHQKAGTAHVASTSALIEIGIREVTFERLRDQIADAGRLEVGLARGQSGTALLDRGWSTPEDWGVWSDGPTARLRLPLPCDGRTWTISVQGYALVDERAQRPEQDIVTRVGPDTVACWTATLSAPAISGEFMLTTPQDPAPLFTDFDFPDAVSPAELGRNDDHRRLGLALEKIVIERT